MKLNFNANLSGKVKTILWIASFWTIIAALQILYEYSLFVEYDSYPTWAQNGNFLNYFLVSTFTFVINGLIAGTLIVFVLQPWFRSQSYGLAILYGVLCFTILFFLLTGLQMYLLAYSTIGFEGLHQEVWRSMRDYFSSMELIRYFMFWLLVLVGTLAGLFISDKYGPGVLKKFLLGKYFHPKEEERIFMFLDLKSSTTIAEKLGEKKYFQFIKEVFAHITPMILKNQGEIYQYVGDEIVISWPIKTGIKHANCIQCFFDIQAALKSKQSDYDNRYGFQPVFKAGLHCGNVIVGEIGVIKRDIAFSGDVLNTAARIQGECNSFGVFLLFSKTLAQLIDFTTQTYDAKQVGVVPLRGKEKPVELYTI